MSDRNKKLSSLKKKESARNVQIIGNSTSFIEIIEATVDEFKDALGVGVEFKNLDVLLKELSSVSAVAQDIKNLNEAIRAINLPTQVSIDGLDALVEVTKALNRKSKISLESDELKLDPKPFIDVSEKISELIVKIESQKVGKQGQNPGDYIPMRRVLMVGKRLMYDDSHYTGGGGGGSNIPIVAGAVPIVNPDGSTLTRAEDTPHTTGDAGMMALAVRNDTGAALAGSDGDYIPLTTDATGALRTDNNGTISANNSSVATLNSGVVFTGTSDEVLNYNEIRVSVFSNVASATDGLSIQQSSDNSNWDITDNYTIPAGVGKTYSVPRQARYFRIVYTNGGTNQASFRLQTILNREGVGSSSQRPSDSYTNETDLEQVQAFGMVYDSTTGLWNRAKGDATGGTTIQHRPDNTTTGSIVANGGTVTATVTPGMAGWTMGYYGTYATGASLTMEASFDGGLTYASVRMLQGSSGVLGYVVTISAVSNSTSYFVADIPSGATHIRVRCSAWAAPTGTINIVLGQSVERFATPVATQSVVVSSVTTITPGVTATSLGKAEDAVHASGDTGVFNLAVGNEAQTTLAGDGDYIGHAVDTKGNTLAVGNVAAAATDAGNPVKIGGKYNLTVPTYADGQRGDVQLNLRGAVKSELVGGGGATAIVGLVDNADAVAVAAVASRLAVIARNFIFNGTSYDRQYGIGGVTSGVATGIAAVGISSGLMPTGTVLNTYSVRITSNTTTTPIASTAYISSITISSEVAGTTSTVTIQDKSGTPLKLVNGLTTVAVTTAPVPINFQTPIKMTSGIDIITAGVAAATVDIWINYYA